MKHNYKTKPSLPLSVAVLSLASLATGPCATDFKDICADRVERFHRSIAVAQAELGAEGRSPASDTAGNAAPLEWSNDTKEHWQEWSLDRLHDLQDYLERLDDYPQFKGESRKITLASNELVMMYGYAQKGDALKVNESLQRIEAFASSALKKACNEVPQE